MHTDKNTNFNCPKIIPLLFIGLFVVISCQAQKVRIALHLNKGQVYSQKLTTNTKSTQTTSGKSYDINVELTDSLTYKVIDIRNGVYDIDVRYITISSKVETPIDINEFVLKESKKDDLLSVIARKVLNKPFHIKITEHGEIREIRGLNLIISNAIDQLSNLNDNQIKTVRDKLEGVLSKESFKNNLIDALNFYPDKPVSVGDLWSLQELQTEDGFTLQSENSYSLDKIGNSFFQIGCKSKVKSLDNEPTQIIDGQHQKIDLKGTIVGNIKVDKKSGWIINSQTIADLRGSIHIEDLSSVPNSIDIPMAIKINSTISD